MATSIGVLPANTKSLANQLFLTPDGKVYVGKDTYYLVSNEEDVLKVGNNISLLNNNVNYISSGTANNQVRPNSELDIRYNVPAHVKNITTQNISDWDAKLEDIIAGDNITIDKTNPFKPIISALESGGIEDVTLTGDVVGSGPGTVVTEIVNNAVTTAKVADKNITLDKIEDAPRRSLLGLGGGGTNTWYVATPSLGSVYNGNWNVNVFYSTGAQVNYNNILYRSNTNPTQGVPPTSNLDQWDAVKNNFRGNYSAAEGYTSNSTVFYNSQYWTTSAPISGVAPDETPVNTPGEPVWVEVSDGLTLGADNKLRSSGSSSITGLITPGANITITGAGTPGFPYQISAASGGGGGGSVTLIPGSGIGITGDSSSGYTITNTSPMVQATTSNFGGVKLTTNTPQSVGANSPSYISGRTYPVQLNSSGQAVVNVPWTDSGGGGGGGNFQLRSGTNPYLTGQTTLLAGSGVQLTQSGSNITITATGSSASVFTRSIDGLVPAPGGSGTTRYLREDGTWAAPAGGGGGSVNLVTAGSSTVGAVRYAGVTKTTGQWYGGVSDPTNSTRLNFDGIIHAGGIVSYGASDINLKTNLCKIENPLEKLNLISGYKFTWKDNDNYCGDDYGVIAQQIESIFPEIISEIGGYKAIKNGNQLTALLIEAVKELSNKVRRLENEL